MAERAPVQTATDTGYKAGVPGRTSSAGLAVFSATLNGGSHRRIKAPQKKTVFQLFLSTFLNAAEQLGTWVRTGPMARPFSKRPGGRCVGGSNDRAAFDGNVTAGIFLLK